jgi:hypothetical protein
MDKQFLFAASGIGVVYAGVTLAVQHFLGPPSAGVVGVALSALALAIFKEFEKLRFKGEQADTTTVAIPRLRLWFLSLSVFGTLGAQICVASIGVLVVVMVKGPAVIFTIFAGMITGDNKVIAGLAIVTGLSFFVAGFVIGKNAPGRAVLHAVVAAFVVNILSLALPAAPAIAETKSLRILLDPSMYLLGAFWVGYIIMAAVGARLGQPSISKAISIQHDSNVQTASAGGD